MHDTVLAYGGSFSTQLDLVSPLINGLSNGAAYGLLGLGLVLLYKSNRIFNFAQAEFGTIAALTAFFGLNGQLFGIPWHMPWLVAVLCQLAGCSTLQPHIRLVRAMTSPMM